MELGIYLVLGVVILVGVIWRIRRLTKPSNRPVTGRRLFLTLVLVIVLIGIDWGVSATYIQYPPVWMTVVTAAVGVVMSLPLIFTTNYERRTDGQIYSQQNLMFVVSFVCLIVIRLFGDILLRRYFNPEIFAYLTYVLVLAYFVPWRLVCWMKFRRLASKNANKAGVSEP
ncbi:CcdC protein domain-containing protein [Alicyclobacillus sp. ALC3]|uniref:CcdC protein domain-containing protein n=1 Tax=Alicyclobacillus sp. ALC3 TaxID=2796143 RepID=UPI00237903F9|nr:CcdC protein domain-containing protein [Alicyclobacillus sp. ALC3]WDL95892.1 DUF1453 family protein [Alicyclobacillus sp. ALC3]